MRRLLVYVALLVLSALAANGDGASNKLVGKEEVSVKSAYRPPGYQPPGPYQPWYQPPFYRQPGHYPPGSNQPVYYPPGSNQPVYYPPYVQPGYYPQEYPVGSNFLSAQKKYK